MSETLVHGILDNDHGSISKAITNIENDLTSPDVLLGELYKYSEKSLRIGITGPPGAGKSTITDALIKLLLKIDKTIGVIAVDPTSPFSGGSLLGDRIRMNKYASDQRVFIRSMGSNGNLGGLARKTQEVGDILAASGKDYILYETVGVGQSEHDIVKVADLCIVVLVPESGDEVQMMKAGLIEIGDIFIINKSDRDGANRLNGILKNILHHFNIKGKIEPPIFNTIGTEGSGISELFSGINTYFTTVSKNGNLNNRRLNRYRQRVLGSIREKLESTFWTDDKTLLLENATKNLEQISLAPHEMAQQILNQSKK